MYPKDRIREKTQQMPPNLMTLFAHVMSRANEGGSRGSAAAHGWDEVLNAAASSSSSSPSSTTSSSSSSSSSGTISPVPCCPMSAQDWRKAEAFSVHLQSLLAAREALCGSNGSNSSSSSRGAGATGGGSGQTNGASSSSFYGPQSGAEGRSSPASSDPADAREPSPFPGGRKDSTPHANGRAKGGRAKAPAAPSGAAATPNNAAGTAWPQPVPGATPKESSSRGGGEEPSAPIKAVGRVAVSRRVNGGAEGAVASLAVSRAGPGAFETPAHTTSHHHHHLHHVHHHADRAGAAGVPGTEDSSGGGGGGNNGLRGREHSPSRYPARLRSRRFPQLGGGGESPESQPPPQHHHDHRTGGAGMDGLEGHQSQGGRRLSPRHSPPASVGREHGRGIPPDARRQHNAHDWVVTAGAEKRAAGAGGGGSGSGSRGEEEGGVFTHDGGSGHEGGGGRASEGYGMRTRAAAPKGSYELGPAAVASSGPSSSPLPGACTPQMTTGAVVSPVPMDYRSAPPPIMSAAAAAAAAAVAAGRPSPRAEVAAPRPRQVLQGGGRAGGRAAPLPRSSVGGRNYTDNHVKQLGLIEAAVVTSATARDRATYNLPRQGRTLTLTNVFKFIALRGAGAMYRLAMDKQVEAHTGRHSNFFDGKIDARIVGVIKKDIGDEAITKSRKFSKILLSLVAEGCTHPDCDWDHTSFTSEKIANLQARMEASTGTSALKFCADPAVFLAAAAAAAAAATPSGSSSARGGGGGSGSGSGSGSVPSSPLSGSAFAGGGASGAAAGGGSSSSGGGGGAHSKRRLDLGRDDDAGQTPSPRLKKLKRAARARVTTAGSTAADGGVESTPTAEGNSKSPPKEEDDMRAAEVLQGLKDIVGSQ